MYVSPQVEVIEMENEGVIASSNVDGYPNVPMSASRTSAGYRGSNASTSDLEDMISDILTVGK